MAIALKCDVCGKLYKNESESGSKVQSAHIKLLTRKYGINGFSEVMNNELDLCPFCMGSMIALLKGLSGEINGDQNESESDDKS